MNPFKILLVFLLLLLTVPLVAQEHSRYYNEGVEQFRTGNYNAAIAAFDKAIAIEKGDPDIWYNRGCAKSMVGNYSGAISDFDAAIMLNPEFTDAYYNRGSVKAAMNDTEGVIADMTSVVELDRDYAEAFATRGQLYFDTDNQGCGCRDLKSAYELGYTKVQDFIKIYCNIPEYFQEVRWTETFELNLEKIGSAQSSMTYEDIELTKKVSPYATRWGHQSTVYELFLRNHVNIPMDDAVADLPRLLDWQGSKHKVKTLDEQDASATKYPWRIVSVENVTTAAGENEAQLWVLVQGEKGLYITGIAVAEKKLSKQQLDTWSAMLKDHKVVRK